MMSDRKTVSIPRACELVGVSRRTIYNWISGGKVEYVRTAGGSVRIFADTLWREPSEEAPAWVERLRPGGESFARVLDPFYFQRLRVSVDDDNRGLFHGSARSDGVDRRQRLEVDSLGGCNRDHHGNGIGLRQHRRLRRENQRQQTRGQIAQICESHMGELLKRRGGLATPSVPERRRNC